jgi:spore germination cell wall hydrolase CwlJ-like protein
MKMVPYTDRDLNLLAHLVYGEARGEPFEGQVAVAAVVLNRVQHPDFPETIEKVIFEPWAFTCVHDGQFKLIPNETAYRAAKEALKGRDPSKGAIYYFNPKTATSSWIWTRKVTGKIGSHLFAV